MADVSVFVQTNHELLRRHGLSVSVQLTREIKNTEEERWALQLIEKNMKELFDASSFGWNLRAKKNQLREDSMVIAIAIDKTKPGGIKMGMACFQPRKEQFADREGFEDVLYCWELQVVKEHQGSGIGSYLMDIVENFAVFSKQECIMLTVLKKNEKALAFYRKHGFTHDSRSPASPDLYDYFILSKKMSSN